MRTVSLQQAASDLAGLIAGLRRDGEIEIRDGDTPVARLVLPAPVAAPPPGREGMRSYGFRGRPDSGSVSAKSKSRGSGDDVP